MNQKMKPSVKKKWLSALRSGKYKQTQKTLKDSNGHCCLGVLCDIHRLTTKKKGNTWKKRVNGQLEYHGFSDVLPPIVSKWAGLKDSIGEPAKNPTLRNSLGYLTSLVGLNDDGVSFKEIARYIEKSL